MSFLFSDLLTLRLLYDKKNKGGIVFPLDYYEYKRNIIKDYTICVKTNTGKNIKIEVPDNLKSVFFLKNMIKCKENGLKESEFKLIYKGICLEDSDLLIEKDIINESSLFTFENFLSFRI